MQTQISLSTLKLHNDRLNELVKELEDYFSFKTPNPKDDLATIMYRAGQASVIDFIKQRLEED
jgi:hypothetical protein